MLSSKSKSFKLCESEWFDLVSENDGLFLLLFKVCGLNVGGVGDADDLYGEELPELHGDESSKKKQKGKIYLNYVD